MTIVIVVAIALDITVITAREIGYFFLIRKRMFIL